MSLHRLLSAAVDNAGFVTLSRAHIEASPLIEYRPGVLSFIADDIRKTPPCGWDWYAPQADDLFDVFYAHAFNAALNGGYFDVDPTRGRIEQWSVDGSGSRALEIWIAGLKADSLLPGTHIADIPAEAANSLYLSLLEGVPYKIKRRDVCVEFTSRERMTALRSLLSHASTNGVHRFELHHADALARLYPAAFGGDPFRKKAILVFTTFAGHLAARGLPVECALPIPADYQLPRIFQWLGALDAGHEITAALDGNRLLDPLSPEVMTLRAGAVVAAADLAALAGTDAFRVDTTLFTKYRVLPEFVREAPPPMRCNSFWF